MNRIIKYSSDDIMNLHNLISKLHKFETSNFIWPWPLNSWESYFNSDYLFELYIVFKGDDIQAFCLWQINLHDEQGELLKICIDLSVRGQGYGKNLLEYSLNALKTYPINNYLLDVATNNISAIKLYESFGFKVIHTKKMFYSDGQSAYSMQHVL